jgi:hypothetical protein
MRSHENFYEIIHLNFAVITSRYNLIASKPQEDSSDDSDDSDDDGEGKKKVIMIS